MAKKIKKLTLAQLAKRNKEIAKLYYDKNWEAVKIAKKFKISLSSVYKIAARNQ